jgi:hypothetical protein
MVQSNTAFKGSKQNFCALFYLIHAGHMSRPYHPTWFECPNST